MGGAAVHAELRRPDLFSAIAKIQENHNDSLTHSLAVWLTYHEYCPTQGDLILYFFDFFLIAWILCELVALQRSRYFRNLCEEPMCSTAWTLSFSERWIVLFIYFCTESPLRCDGRCVFLGGFFVYSYVLISSVGQPCYISEITGKRRRERLLIRRKRNRERCI